MVLIEPKARNIQRGPNLQTVIAQSTPILVLGGILAYVELALYYDRFYADLSISPAEVGLGYGSLLAASTEWIVVVVGIVSLISLVLATIMRSTKLAGGNRWSLSYWFLASFASLLTLVVLASFIFSPLAGARWAEAVGAGRPVITTPTGPLVNIPLHAEPATIAPIGKPQDSPPYKH